MEKAWHHFIQNIAVFLVYLSKSNNNGPFSCDVWHFANSSVSIGVHIGMFI